MSDLVKTIEKFALAINGGCHINSGVEVQAIKAAFRILDVMTDEDLEALRSDLEARSPGAAWDKFRREHADDDT